MSIVTLHTRMMPGDDPPNTTLSEVYYPPLPGFGVRGADIDSKGVVWVSLGSGHLGEFDRSRCEGPLTGPTATGFRLDLSPLVRPADD